MSILVVGEFLTSGDAEAGEPFRDGLGKMLRSFLHSAGISPRECEFTCVILEESPGRGVYGFCGMKDEGIPRVRALTRGKYVLARYEEARNRLWNKINATRPNLVIALGDLALWALTSEPSLKNARGRITSGNSGIPGIKVLPTYAPRQIAADYSLRPILLADLSKARRQSLFPEVRRPQRFVHLYPSLSDLHSFSEEFISDSPKLDVDIETKGSMITCVGFAPSPERVLVVPFFSEASPAGNYWPTMEEELLAWQWVRETLALPKRVCGQNFQYDAQYLWREMGIPIPGFTDDTMLMHHALQIEMPKGLGFLASCYTDELAWKFMMKIAASDRGVKKGDGNE